MFTKYIEIVYKQSKTVRATQTQIDSSKLSWKLIHEKFVTIFKIISFKFFEYYY